MKRSPINWSGMAVPAALLLIWEIGARSEPRLQLFLPPATQVLASLLQAVASGQIVAHLAVTVERFLIAYLAAALLGIILGTALGFFRAAYSFLHVAIELLRPMPSVAIIPVAILLVGIGDAMVVAVTVYATLWPILINTIDGVSRVDRTLIDTGRTFGLSRLRILRRIVLPAAAPYIATGLRIGLAIALILVTTAEMIAGSKGLGFFILDEERSMQPSRMYAGIVLVALLGYGLNRLFLLLQAKALSWRRGASAGEALS